MLTASIFTEITITGITVYGLGLLFVKALLLLLLAQTLADQFELSPAAIRHSIWLVAMASLAALPLLAMLLPAWGLFSIEMPASAVLVADYARPSATSAAGQALSTLDWLVFAYLLVVLLRLIYLVIEIAKVAWLTAIAEEAGSAYYDLARIHFPGRIKIKISRSLQGPVTWGRVYPVILLPSACRQWSPQTRDMVLQHELGHIRRADWLAQLLGQLVAILYWPVPGMRKALSALSLAAEQACDDVVLSGVEIRPGVIGHRVEAADYAALLLSQARIAQAKMSQPTLSKVRGSQSTVHQTALSQLSMNQQARQQLPATVALAKPSELAQRIGHIVDSYVGRAGEKVARRWFAIAASIFILPFASIQAVGNVPVTGLWARGIEFPDFIDAPAQLSDELASTALAPVQQPVQLPTINRPVRPAAVSQPPRLLIQSSIQSSIQASTTSSTQGPAQATSMVTIKPWQRTAVTVSELALPQQASAIAVVEPWVINGVAWRSKVQPDYPLAARRRGIEGRVVVEFDIDSLGRVVKPRIIQAAPTQLFNSTVLAAVSSYRYEPAQLAGQAVALTGFREEFSFQLVEDAPNPSSSPSDAVIFSEKSNEKDSEKDSAAGTAILSKTTSAKTTTPKNQIGQPPINSS